MGDYVLKYILKQDSPMIHFQGTTPGAALRPSEVKPKLDRFLKEWCERNKEWCGEKGISEKEQNGWKADPTHEAYDYKMRIYAGKSLPVAQDKLPSYFSDFGEVGSNLLQSYMKLEIICFHEKLREVIKEAIETFFVLHNFGTRQNRGIGGFTLKQTTPKDAERLLVKWFGKQKITIYKMEFQNANAVNILKCGNMFYQILKSGINDGRTYIKSYLTKYFLDRLKQDAEEPDKKVPQLIGGEKRWMKEKGISPKIGKVPPYEPAKVNGYRYIRGLLGTASHIRYINESGKDETVTISWAGAANNPERLELDRVPSPIRYKIVGNVLFVLPLRPGKDLLGQGKMIYGEKFSFYNETTKKKGTLEIPHLNDEFTMDGLMKGYMKYLLNGIIKDKDKSVMIKNYAERKNITLPTLAGNQWIQLCKVETT